MFTDDNKHLFFGVAEALYKEPEDSLTKAEKAVVDVWHYQDKRLQPQQLLEEKRDRQASDLYVMSLETFTPIRLEKDELKTLSRGKT